jgi:hypothetical protein
MPSFEHNFRVASLNPLPPTLLPPPLPLLPPLPLAPPLPLVPQAATWGSGPVLSRPKKLTTELASIGVVWPPLAWVCASRTVNAQEFCHF